MPLQSQIFPFKSDVWESFIRKTLSKTRRANWDQQLTELAGFAGLATFMNGKLWLNRCVTFLFDWWFLSLGLKFCPRFHRSTDHHWEKRWRTLWPFIWPWPEIPPGTLWPILEYQTPHTTTHRVCVCEREGGRERARGSDRAGTKGENKSGQTTFMGVWKVQLDPFFLFLSKVLATANWGCPDEFCLFGILTQEPRSPISPKCHSKADVLMFVACSKQFVDWQMRNPAYKQIQLFKKKKTRSQYGCNFITTTSIERLIPPKNVVSCVQQFHSICHRRLSSDNWAFLRQIAWKNAELRAWRYPDLKEHSSNLSSNPEFPNFAFIIFWGWRWKLFCVLGLYLAVTFQSRQGLNVNVLSSPGVSEHHIRPALDPWLNLQSFLCPVLHMLGMQKPHSCIENMRIRGYFFTILPLTAAHVMIWNSCGFFRPSTVSKSVTVGGLEHTWRIAIT